MSFGRRVPSFGKKQIEPAPAAPSRPLPPRDSDGKRRVFGETAYAQHGDMLRSLGLDINDANNILLEPEDFNRMVKQSLADQEKRRCAIEAELLARHGVNAIRPFFVLAEPVMNSPIGTWLIRTMRLMPYEDWNLVYLPTDRATAAVMDLPLHPCQSIGPIDELMVDRIGTLHRRHLDAMHRTEQAERHLDPTAALAAMEQFAALTEHLRKEIIDYVTKVKPMIVDLIADVQSKQAP